jgi:hypothetical protein
MTTETYKLNAMGGVQRLSDGAFIPEDERNADWRAYQKWVSEGGTAFAADYEAPVGEAQATGKRKAKDVRELK